MPKLLGQLDVIRMTVHRSTVDKRNKVHFDEKNMDCDLPVHVGRQKKKCLQKCRGINMEKMCNK